MLQFKTLNAKSRKEFCYYSTLESLYFIFIFFSFYLFFDFIFIFILFYFLDNKKAHDHSYMIHHMI